MYKFGQIKSQNLENSPQKSLVLFFGLFFFGMFLGNVLSDLVVLWPSSGFDTSRFEYLSKNFNTTCLDVYLCYAFQSAFMIITFFIIPFIYLHFIEQKDFSYFSHPKAWKSKPILFFVLCFILILAVYPVSLKLREYTILAIDNGFFGSFGFTMKTLEESQQTLIDSMLDVQSVGQFLLLIIIIAVLPAIGEELVFRGIIQSLMIQAIKKPIVSILITAFIFSLLHFSLTDFLPRLFLGAVLGVSYYYSKNIWVPIGLHFLNNALSVVYYLGLEKNQVAVDIEAPGSISIFLVMISLTVFALIFMQIKKFSGILFEEDAIISED